MTIDQQLELPEAHMPPFTVFITVQITPARPLSSSLVGQDADQGQHSSFRPHWSTLPSTRPIPLHHKKLRLSAVLTIVQQNLLNKFHSLKQYN
jgi:hypothetical protein